MIDLDKIGDSPVNDAVIQIPDRSPQISANAIRVAGALKALFRLQSVLATNSSTAVDTPTRTAVLTNTLPSASSPKAAPGFSVCIMRIHPGKIGYIIEGAHRMLYNDFRKPVRHDHRQ